MSRYFDKKTYLTIIVLTVTTLVNTIGWIKLYNFYNKIKYLYGHDYSLSYNNALAITNDSEYQTMATWGLFVIILTIVSLSLSIYFCCKVEATEALKIIIVIWTIGILVEAYFAVKYLIVGVIIAALVVAGVMSASSGKS